MMGIGKVSDQMHETPPRQPRQPGNRTAAGMRIATQGVFVGMDVLIEL